MTRSNRSSSGYVLRTLSSIITFSSLNDRLICAALKGTPQSFQNRALCVVCWSVLARSGRASRRRCLCIALLFIAPSTVNRSVYAIGSVSPSVPRDTRIAPRGIRDRKASDSELLAKLFPPPGFGTSCPTSLPSSLSVSPLGE